VKKLWHIWKNAFMELELINMARTGIGQNFHVEFQHYLQNHSWDIFIALPNFIKPLEVLANF
jgi:hypothetical protein